MDLKVSMFPKVLDTKSKFTKDEKEQLLNESWCINYQVNGKRRQWRGRYDEPINRVMDFDERLQLMIINKAAIVQGLNNGSLAKLDKDFIDYNNPTVAMAAKLYLDELYRYNPNKRSVNLYRYKIEILVEKFGDLRLRDVSRKETIEFMREVRFNKGWTTGSTMNCLNIFKAFYNWAIEEKEFIEINVFNINRILFKHAKKEKSKIRKPYSFDDLEIIMNHIAPNKLLSLFAKTLYYTCIRPNELRQLKVRDINFYQRTIFVSDEISKTKQDGWVDIDDNLYQLFIDAGLDKAPKNDYLFSCHDNIHGAKQMGYNMMGRQFREALIECGLHHGTGYTLYSLKHTSNCLRVIDDWLPTDIMILNRHHNINTTMIYTQNLKLVYNLNLQSNTEMCCRLRNGFLKQHKEGSLIAAFFILVSYLTESSFSEHHKPRQCCYC